MAQAHDIQQLWHHKVIAQTLQQIHYAQKLDGLKLLSVSSLNERAGQTTLAITLATGLSQLYKQKILYFDLNPNGDVLLTKLLNGQVGEDGLITQSDLPFSIFRLKDLTFNWNQNIFDSLFLSKLILAFKEDFDLLIIDSHLSIQDLKEDLNIVADSYLLLANEETIKRKSEKLTEELKEIGINILGLIKNG
ncbi:MAG: hypothetical protein Fur0010_28210 [Bdellovibrio sp.]